MYSKHAPDFNFNGNWNKDTASLFEKALNDHIDAPDTIRFPGTYHKIPVIHNLDPNTRVDVLQSPSGNLISGWRLNPQQLWNVVVRGSL